MQVTQTEIEVREGQSGVIVMTVKDETGALVQTAALTGITLDLYDLKRYKAYLAAHAAWVEAGSVAEDEPEDDSTINSRTEQDVLNVNGGTFYNELQTITIDGASVSFNFRFDYTPEDTPFFGSDAVAHQAEAHIAHFRFSWDEDDKAIPHEVLMRVTNMRRYPASE